MTVPTDPAERSNGALSGSIHCLTHKLHKLLLNMPRVLLFVLSLLAASTAVGGMKYYPLPLLRIPRKVQLNDDLRALLRKWDLEDAAEGLAEGGWKSVSRLEDMEDQDVVGLDLPRGTAKALKKMLRSLREAESKEDADKARAAHNSVYSSMPQAARNKALLEAARAAWGILRMAAWGILGAAGVFCECFRSRTAARGRPAPDMSARPQTIQT